MARQSNEISGIQKAAILLITLGPERSANIFKHLKEDEIEALTLEIANTRSVSSSVKDQVLDEFYEICLAQQYIAEGGIAYPGLEKALVWKRPRKLLENTASHQVRLLICKMMPPSFLTSYRTSILKPLL